jgi:hypothetical protein
VVLAWSEDPEDYVNDSVPTGPMLDRLKVMTQTKRVNLVLQAGGWE